MFISRYFSFMVGAIIFGAVSTYGAGHILRNPDGNIRYFNHGEAMSACPAGSRLPTIRQLGEIGQSLGAQGILELSQVEYRGQEPAGYYEVMSTSPTGRPDQFYYNHFGYKVFVNILPKDTYWSSSNFAFGTGRNSAYTLNAYYGGFEIEDKRQTHAVLCIPL